jgi:transposase-like protein
VCKKEQEEKKKNVAAESFNAKNERRTTMEKTYKVLSNFFGNHQAFFTSETK